MSRKTVLVAGASGLVGTSAVQHFARLGDWDVIAVSRRAPLDMPATVHHVPADLTDEAACAEAFGGMSAVTHVIYAAVTEKLDDIWAGWSDPVQIARNASMLRNLMEPLLGVAKGLEHVSLVHGAKAYGCHLPQAHVPIPMRESLPRFVHPNFYHEQEDYIRDRQHGQRWHWTVWRPVGIAGAAIGSPMNSYLLMPIFAAMHREAGHDMPVPAGVCLVNEATDADLIAEALEWATASPAARNEVFNISNGDVVSHRERFPVVAECLGMALGEPRRINAAQEVREMADLWPAMVRRYGLRAPEDVTELFSGSLDMSNILDLPPGGDPLQWGLVSTIKLRKAGFHGCTDTLDMVRKIVRHYQAMRILPP